MAPDRITNAPAEAANNLIKRDQRIGFGFTRFRNDRIRILLYAGRAQLGTKVRCNPKKTAHAA